MEKVLLCLYYAILPIFAIQQVGHVKPYDELYADSLDAYWNENWDECIKLMNDALANYKILKAGIQDCSLSCSPKQPSNKGSIDTIKEQAMCIHKCEEEKFGKPESLFRVSDEVKQNFKSMKPYQYLQYAYFKNGELAKSVAATFTYASYDQENKMMQDNLEYYQKHENVTDDMFVNLEPISFIDDYDYGIQAYNREDYKEAVAFFEKALSKYYQVENECRAQCEMEFDAGSEYQDEATNFHRQITDHYRSVLECYMKCPNEAARVNNESYVRNFVPKIYHYLQFAYYNLDQHKNAARSAKSYLLFYPNNQLILNNLKYFKNAEDTTPIANASKFSRRLKAQSQILRHIYQSFGLHDVDENLLNPFMQDEDENTEGNLDSNDVKIEDSAEPTTVTPDDSATLEETKAATNIDAVINDSANKENNLTEAEGDKAEVNKPRKKKTKKNAPPITPDYDSMKHKTDDMIESKDAYNVRMDEIRAKRDAGHDLDVDVNDMKIGYEVVDSKSVISIVDPSSLSEPAVAEGPLLHSEVTMLSNSTQMGGPLRFALDHFANEKQCQDLIDLELSGGILGDGYLGKASPHSKHELFQGLSVFSAVKLAERGKVPVKVAALYFDLSEQVRQQVKLYFKLEELYFDFTHLVCRTPVASDSSVDRVDLSHPVHSDNCILKPDASCIKETPAYTWRDYSSILYLNEEFEGGEFIMTDSTARRVKMKLKPKCGRLVSFSAGKECLHGVKPVSKGRRCAMALWFTLDRNHNEKLRQQAGKILKRLMEKDEL